LAQSVPPNGLELSCPAEAGNVSPIFAHSGGQGTFDFPHASRVRFSELLGSANLTYRVTRVMEGANSVLELVRRHEHIVGVVGG